MPASDPRYLLFLFGLMVTGESRTFLPILEEEDRWPVLVDTPDPLHI